MLKSLQSWPTRCDPIDCSPPGSSVGVSRQEYQSRWPFLSPGIFLTQGSNSRLLCLLHWQVGSLPLVPALICENTKQATVHSTGKGPHQNSTTLAPESQTFSHMTWTEKLLFLLLFKPLWYGILSWQTELPNTSTYYTQREETSYKSRGKNK